MEIAVRMANPTSKTRDKKESEHILSKYKE